MLKSATNAINAIPSLPESNEIASKSPGGMRCDFYRKSFYSLVAAVSNHTGFTE